MPRPLFNQDALNITALFVAKGQRPKRGPSGGCYHVAKRLVTGGVLVWNEDLLKKNKKREKTTAKVPSVEALNLSVAERLSGRQPYANGGLDG